MHITHKSFLTASIVFVALMACVVEAHAQCAMARRLGGAEDFRRHPRIKIETGSFPNDGNELGSIWVVGLPAFNSGGPHFKTRDRCPSSGEGGWWKSGTKFLGEDSGIETFVASPTCLFTNCPPNGATLITVLEDRSADGSDAAFIAYVVDESPANRRFYDHARTEQMTKGRVTTHRLTAYPSLRPATEGGGAASSAPLLKLEGYTGQVHAVSGKDNRRLGDEAAIASFDILTADGRADPGRSRGAWKVARRVAVEEAGQAVNLGDDICPAGAHSRWVAVGVTFVDGVESRLVGRALQLNCSNSGREAAE